MQLIKFKKYRSCNGGLGILNGYTLDIAYTLLEPYVLVENYNESKEENSTYRQNLKPISGSTHALMKVLEKKFGFSAHYVYHLTYTSIYGKNGTAPGLLEEVNFDSCFTYITF